MVITMYNADTSSMDSIIAKLKENMNYLKDLGIIKVGVFGSIVRGEEKRKSDIDILIKFDKSKKTFRNYLKCLYFLEELLERKIDLLTFESLSPFIGPTS